MANRLSELFDSTTASGRDLVASPPRSLDQMTASGSADADALQAKLEILGRVRPRVDYSDFANFVCFNSALDYFNLCGERMINEWPYDGRFADQLAFQSQSDNYQDYLLSVWPTWIGSLSLSSGAFVTASDAALVSGSAVSSYLALGTGSWTVEAHVSCSDAFQVWSKNVSGSSTSSVVVTVGPSSADMVLVDASGVAVTASVSGDFTGSRYMAWTIYQSASVLEWQVYTINPFDGDFDQTVGPVLAGFGSASFSGFATGPGGFQVGGSGSGQVAEVRVWDEARSAAQLRANYNTRVYQSDGLSLYWRMCEGASGTIIADYSGHRINGIMYGLVGWQSGSFGRSPQDTGEYMLNLHEPILRDFVEAKQASAADHDRNNPSIITNMVPAQYLDLEDERNTHVLKDLLYTLARQFDEVKVAIDQIPHLVTPSYTGFDDAPDALLADALRFWGWDTKGNFLSKEAFQYFFGYDVLSGEQAQYDNQRLEIELYKIKNEFWRRTLQNIAYLYKKKGTREGVEALFRIYGVDEKLVKLKEFGLRPEVGIATNRIASSKSTTYVKLSGTSTVETSGMPLPHLDPTGALSINMQVRFPRRDESPSLLTGSVFHIFQGASNALSQQMAFPLGAAASGGLTRVEELRYTRSPFGATDPATGQYVDQSGTLHYVISDPTGSAYEVAHWDVPIFDGQWYSLALTRERAESSYTGSADAVRLELHVYHLDGDMAEMVYETTDADDPVPSTVLPGGYDFSLGRHDLGIAGWNATSGSEYSTRNVQIWELHQTKNEILDHTLNPFSHGADIADRWTSMSLCWEFDDSKDPAGVAHNSGRLGNAADGTVYGSVTYARDVFDYNFIAPVEYGWNEDKVRAVDGVRTSPEDTWNESNIVALEFNLMDALNEDISLMMSSMDNWNNVIGEPSNRFRGSYPELDRVRQQYFSRLTGRINFRAFADFLDFFDRSFVDLVAKMLPARAKFKGAEFVVESHMLERPKVQYTYRRHAPVLVPEGEILMYSPGYRAVAEMNLPPFPVAPPPSSGSSQPVTFSPSMAVVYTGSVNVTLSTLTPSATIYYTTDGTSPTTASSVYSSPVQLTSSSLIIAFAVAPGFDPSTPSAATYNVYVPVIPAVTLVGIDVLPLNPLVYYTGTEYWTGSQQFTAIGNYSDNSTQDLTSLVTWVSSDTGSVVMDNGTPGLAKAVLPPPPPLTTATLYAVASWGSPDFVASNDGGTTWNPIRSSDTQWDWRWATPVDGSGTIVGVGGDNGSWPTVIRSTDYGNNWAVTSLSGAGTPFNEGEMITVASNASVVVGAGMFRDTNNINWPTVWTSTDKGETWSRNQLDMSSIAGRNSGTGYPEITHLVWVPGIDKFVAVGHDNGNSSGSSFTFRGSADGQTWELFDQTSTILSAYLSTGIYGGIATDGNNVVFFPWRTSTVYRSADGGATWLSSSMPPEVGGIDCQQAMTYGSGTFVAVGGANGTPYAIYSTDAGVTWGATQLQKWYTSLAYYEPAHRFVAMDPSSPAWVGTTDDGGVTWAEGTSSISNFNVVYMTEGPWAMPDIFTGSLASPTYGLPSFGHSFEGFSNTGYTSNYWRINTPVGGDVTILVRGATDVPWPQSSTLGLTFDSRLWLYDATGSVSPILFNDDVTPDIDPNGLYYSAFKTTLSASRDYWIEVSSYTAGDNFDYFLEFSPGVYTSATLLTSVPFTGPVALVGTADNPLVMKQVWNTSSSVIQFEAYPYLTGAANDPFGAALDSITFGTGSLNLTAQIVQNQSGKVVFNISASQYTSYMDYPGGGGTFTYHYHWVSGAATFDAPFGAVNPLSATISPATFARGGSTLIYAKTFGTGQYDLSSLSFPMAIGGEPVASRSTVGSSTAVTSSVNTPTGSQYLSASIGMVGSISNKWIVTPVTIT